MDFRELEYFTSIAEEANLSRAAEKLYVGQPTLSKSLNRLEAQLGMPLFSRCGKQLHLTYAGERFLSYARQLLEIRNSLEKEMSDIQKLDKGAVRLGMPPVRCSYVLPAVLPAFRKACPNVKVTITEDSSTNLDAALMNGEIDIAFFSVYAERNELSYRILQKDQMYVIVSQGHPIGEMAVSEKGMIPAVKLEWLKEETFLLQQRTQRQGGYIAQVLREHHFEPAAVQEHKNIPAAVSLASGGYGVTFLAGGLIPYLQKTCTFDYYRIQDVSFPIQFAAAWKKGTYQPKYTVHLADLVEAFCAGQAIRSAAPAL